jgi:hypothetical protein
MRTADRLLLGGWLLAALVLLGIDGRLGLFLVSVTPASLLTVGVAVLIRQQRAPSSLDRPPLPERYRVADDLAQPLAVVVAVAEAEATRGP